MRSTEPRRFRRLIARCVIGVLLVLTPGPAHAEITYDVTLSEIENDRLAELLLAVSELERRKGEPVATEGVLRRRARDDTARLREVLRAEGYYAGTVAFQLQPPVEADGAFAVTLDVETGPPFSLEGVDIRFRGDGPTPDLGGLNYDELGLLPGARSRAEDILAAQQRLIERLGWTGYPYAVVADREVVVDHAMTSVSVSFVLAPGAYTVFGGTEIAGLAAVDDEVVRRDVQWQEGAPFDLRQVRATRRALSRSGLFSSVSVSYPQTGPPDGRAPMRIALIEDAARSVGAGLKASTSEGLGATAFWEHRNFFGSAERLRVQAVAASEAQSLETSLRIPAFLADSQSLILSATASRERPEAFDADTVGASAVIDRPLGEAFRGSAGVSIERTRLEDEFGDEKFNLIGLPLALIRDTTDDLLNPTSGGRAQLSATPYTGIGDTDANFAVLRFSDSAHLALDRDKRFILAGRGTIGSIVGESRRGVPSDKRFYAGGADTIRGYEFQLVGPLDAEDDPLGGRALLAGSIEFRARITETLGGVVFLDGGNVYEDNLPDLDEELFFGAGVGFRYFTPVGPLRLDVAVPLDKRSVDDDFQIYVSLGQAF